MENLNIAPFSLSPDPTSLYLTPTIRSTLLKVAYTLDKRQGLTTIFGDIGIGKSSLLRHIYSSYASQENVITCLLTIRRNLTVYNFLREICYSLNVGTSRSFGTYFSALEVKVTEYYRDGINIVLFCDEANLLSNDGLELVRSMLNFETNHFKTIQIVLAGQLDLKERLEKPKGNAIRSRVSTYSILDPMSPQEIAAMLDFRCQRVGIELPFSPREVEEIYTVSGGVPRVALKLAGLAYDLRLKRAQLDIPGLAQDVWANTVTV